MTYCKVEGESMIKTICPGCGLGCGLYLEGDEERGLKVWHRKRAPVNVGKLCAFGMSLPQYYDRERLNNTVDGKPVTLDEAVSEAVKRLKGVKPEELAFVSVGAATCEELASFINLCKGLGCKNLELGLNAAFKTLPESLHELLEIGVPLADVERASKLVLFFVEPFLQYPLLARRILKAKKNGAKVFEVAFVGSERGIADETVLLDATAFINAAAEELKKLRARKDVFEDALVISEANPYTDAVLLREMFAVCAECGATLLLMKPFLTTSAALLQSSLAPETKQGLSLLEVFEDERVKALFLLETDPAGALLLNERKIRKRLSELELLVEQGAFRTVASELAGVTLASEAFFEKRGVIVNVEGRVLENGGTSAAGVEILERMVEGVTGGRRSFEEVRSEVFGTLGLGETSPKEDDVQVKRKETKVLAEPEGLQGGATAVETARGAEAAESGDYLLLYRTTPAFWSGVFAKSFVEISVDAARSLKLFRDDNVEISNAESVTLDFKISERLPERLIVSETKLAGVSERLLSPVRLRRKE